MQLKSLYLMYLCIIARFGTSVSSQRGWTDLVRWLESNGALVHQSLIVDEVAHGGMTIRGLLTDKELPAGTVFLRIPKHLWLTGASVPQVTACKLADAMALDKLRLAAAASFEKSKKDESFYAPYLKLYLEYPDFGHLPSLAGEAIVKDFSGLPMMGIIRDGRKAWQEKVLACFESYQKQLGNPLASMTNAEIEAALFAVETMAVTFNPDGTDMVLIPGLSFLNTDHNAEVNAEWDIQGDAVELKTTRIVAAGKELLANYCGYDCDNEVMLSTWGVYLEQNSVRINDLGAVDCSVHTPMLSVTKSTLDISDVSSALDAGWTAPRCVSGEITHSADQWPLRCSLARLAWESCAFEWGYRSWQARDSSRLSKALFEHSISYKNLAHKYHQEGDLAQVATHYQTALALLPDAATYGLLGTVLEEMGNLEGALQSYKSSAQLNPLVLGTHVRLAYALERTGNIEGAKKSFQAALHIDPKIADLQSRFGKFFERQGDSNNAHKRFKMAFKLDPRDLQNRKNLAESFTHRQEYKDAEKVWRSVVKLDPQDAEAENKLGQVLAWGGDLDSAGKRFQAAIRINPGMAAYYHNRGLIQQHTGSPGDAEKSYRLALKLDPHHAKAREDLSKLMERRK